MITVRFHLTHSFNAMVRRKPVAVQAAPLVLFKISALVEGVKTQFGLPVALMDEIPKYMKFGISPRTEITNFICLLGSGSVTDVVTVATEVRHTRARIKYARARENRNREYIFRMRNSMQNEG